MTEEQLKPKFSLSSQAGTTYIFTKSCHVSKLHIYIYFITISSIPLVYIKCISSHSFSVIVIKLPLLKCIVIKTVIYTKNSSSSPHMKRQKQINCWTKWWLEAVKERYLLFPIFNEKHWTLLVLDTENGSWKFYYSMRPSSEIDYHLNEAN